MKFTIVLEPKGQTPAQGRAFWVGGKVIASKPLKEVEQLLEEEKLFTLMCAHWPPELLQGPLLLGVKAFLPIHKSQSKKWQSAALAGEIRPTTKPNLDNCNKSLKEFGKGVFWLDDMQVVEYLLGTGKYYGDPARWKIEIEKLDRGLF